MILVSSCSCLGPIHWSQVLSREWRCSWSSADRRCPNYIWGINNLIAYKGATYIRDLTVCIIEVITLPADDLAPTGARSSASTVIPNSIYHRYTRPTLKGLISIIYMNTGSNGWYSCSVPHKVGYKSLTTISINICGCVWLGWHQAIRNHKVNHSQFRYASVTIGYDPYLLVLWYSELILGYVSMTISNTV